MLRGAAVLLLQKWQPDAEPPAPETISNDIETVEADD
jgi:hypothetical protein